MDWAVDKATRAKARLEEAFADNLPNLGKLIATVGSVMAFTSLASNKLSQPIQFSSFMIVRSALNAQISAKVLFATGGKMVSAPSYLRTIVLRCFMGVACAYLYIQGISFLELNHFYSLVNTQPIFTFWLGYFLMGETYSHDRFVCTILAVLGVILVVNPDYFYFRFADSHERYENFYAGILTALGAAFLKAIILILIKQLSGESPYKTMLWFEGFRVVCPGLVLIFTRDFIRFATLESLFYALLSGVLEWVYQILCLLSMRYERASVVGIIETLSIVLGFLFDIFVMGSAVHLGSVVGTACIVGSALYLTSLK